MEKLAKIFGDITGRGVEPDLITSSTVIKGYCVQGDLEQALHLFTRMRKQGITPDAILFNSILENCARKHMRTFMEKVLADMEESNVATSNFMLSILVKLYCRFGDLDRAFKVVETYPAKYGFELNATVYTCLMSSCILNDYVERALKLFEKMKRSKCSPDVKTYVTLINGCLKKEKLLTEAVKLVDDAMGLGEARCSGPKAPLEHETIEGVLSAITRCRKSPELGVPLMERLRKAGIEVFLFGSSSASLRLPFGTSSAPLWRLFGSSCDARF